jgi:ABC-type amino acid transport substrate-binding protein
MTKHILIFLLAVAVTLLIDGRFKNDGNAAAGSTVLARVEKTKTLRCAYNVEPPSIIVDPNTGKVSGVSADIVEHMAALLGWQVEWTEQAGWSEMTAGLDADRYDLACVGRWIHTPQTHGSAFTLPLFYSAVHGYGRANETRFDDTLNTLNDPAYAIATQDGEFNYYVAKDRFPKAQTVSVPALTDTGIQIMNVLTHKADVIFLNAALADDYMRAHPGKLRRLTKEPVVVFDTAFMYKNGESAFGDILNGALRELHSNGYIRRTLDKWQASPESFLRVAKTFEVP